MITADQLRAMALARSTEANLNSIVVAHNAYGRRFGLDKPHRMVVESRR